MANSSNVAGLVDRAVRTAGVPILGVSIGNPADRATWSVVFDPSATAGQRTTAATVLASVAIDAPAQAIDDEKNAQGEIDAWPIVTRALVLALIDQLNVIRAALPTPLPAIAPAQAIAAIRLKAGTL